MNRKPFENNSIQNPKLHGIWAEQFPKVVRYGVLGAVAISALIWAHNKLSSNSKEIDPPQDQVGPGDQAA